MTQNDAYVEYKPNEKIYFDNGFIKGTGIVCGKATTAQAVIGNSWIIQPDEKIPDYPYSHIVIFGVHMMPTFSVKE